MDGDTLRCNSKELPGTGKARRNHKEEQGKERRKDLQGTAMACPWGPLAASHSDGVSASHSDGVSMGDGVRDAAGWSPSGACEISRGRRLGVLFLNCEVSARRLQPRLSRAASA